MMYYDNIVYAEERLRNTIVNTIEKIPIFVAHVYHNEDKKFVIGATILENGAGKEVPLTNIDLIPVPLGYMNTNNGPVFVTRRPVRKWKQGLSLENVVYYGPYTTTESFPIKYLDKTIRNIYPSVYKVVSEEKKNGEAFCRAFALDKEKKLCYHGRAVGKWSGSKFYLDDQHTYLYDRLLDDVGEELL